MFDPDPTCPLALEHGCEKFGVMVDLKKVTTLTMYNDKGYAVEENKLVFGVLFRLFAWWFAVLPSVTGKRWLCYLLDESTTP